MGPPPALGPRQLRAAAAGASPMLLGESRLCASKAAAAAAQSEGDGDRPGERWCWQRATATAAAAGEDMDESSLLDLLECSVCLERLDTTAKVLPCQHTFCRRCLESILCSRHELRCPECRILVGCGVDELPANILLVRLLDGIRQRPRAGASPGGSPPARSGPGSGAAAEVAGGRRRAMGSAPGSPVFPLEVGSQRELTTSRNASLAKVGSLLGARVCVCLPVSLQVWGAVGKGSTVTSSFLFFLQGSRECNPSSSTCQFLDTGSSPSPQSTLVPLSFFSAPAFLPPSPLEFRSHHLRLLCGATCSRGNLSRVHRSANIPPSQGVAGLLVPGSPLFPLLAGAVPPSRLLLNFAPLPSFQKKPFSRPPDYPSAHLHLPG